jgi:hypothetical protein
MKPFFFEKILLSARHYCFQVATFSQVCDAKLASISRRIGQLDKALRLLEAKLDSVPGHSLSVVVGYSVLL